LELDDMGNRLSFCAGGNYALLGAANPVWHAYAGGTFTSTRTSITLVGFYKIGEPSIYRLTGRNLFDFSTRYDAGSFGLGMGLDTRLTERGDLHFIGELWNPNVLQPVNTAVLVGLRLCNTSVAMDFGLALFTQPNVFPFVSFVWTPF
jgi:hypothetical protein